MQTADLMAAALWRSSIGVLGCCLLAGSAVEAAAPLVTTAAGHPTEGRLESFLGRPPALEFAQLSRDGRFPNVVTGVDGSVVAIWGSERVRVRRSDDGGTHWSDEAEIAPGRMGGGAIVDETSGELLAFVEERHPPAPLTVFRSRDHGASWSVVDVRIAAGAQGRVPSMHMTEAGITLRHGQRAGRMIRAARDYAGGNDREEWPQHQAVAIYSDDGGSTWKTSQPFPAPGIGEGAITELSDGRLYFNCRRHWGPPGINTLRRWTAWSEDDGETWQELSMCDVLPDGPQDTTYGCMGGLVRLPIAERDVLIYSNCDSAQGRNHGTLWASFDGAVTWPLKRLLYEGEFGYSSLAAGRPDTPSEGWIYLMFESHGEKMARFNLQWLLAGEPTGDGELPAWLSP